MFATLKQLRSHRILAHQEQGSPGLNRNSRKRRMEEAIIQQCHEASARRHSYAAQQEAAAANVACSYAGYLALRLSALDGILETEHRMSSTSRRFVRTSFLNEVLGVQRRCVEEVCNTDPNISPARLVSILNAMATDVCELTTDEITSSLRKLCMGKVQIEPIEREMGKVSVKMPFGPPISEPRYIQEFSVLDYLSRSALWDREFFPDLKLSLSRMHHNAIQRDVLHQEVHQMDVLDGFIAASEPITKEYIEGVAARGGELIGSTDDMLPLYYLHAMDGAGTVDAIGTSQGSDNMVFAYSVLLNIHPRRRLMHHVVMLQAVACLEDVARFGVRRMIGGGATPEQEACDRSSWLYCMKQLAAGYRTDVETPDGSLRKNQLFKGVDLVHMMDTPEAQAGAGFKKAMGLHTKSVCRHCNASQLDPPDAFDYRLPGTLQCIKCSKIWCTACVDSLEHPNTKPFVLRTRVQYDAQQRAAEQLPPSQRAQMMQLIGINTFDHAYVDVPFSSQYQPGLRAVQDKMHIIDEAGCARYGGATVWFCVESGVATLEEMRHATLNYPHYSKYRLNGERPIFLHNSLTDSTTFHLNGAAIKGPSRSCHLSGKAASIALWTFYSLAILLPFIERKYGNTAKPDWWLAWTMWVDVVALVCSPQTNEAWGAQLANAIMKHQIKVLGVQPCTNSPAPITQPIAQPIAPPIATRIAPIALRR